MIIKHVETTDSTNLLALREFANLADNTLLTADSQTGGMGRRGRSWLSPTGVNLYATYIVKNPQFPPGDAMLAGGLATLHTLRKFAPGIQFWLKWPNDVCCGPPPMKQTDGVGMKSETIVTENTMENPYPNTSTPKIEVALLRSDLRGFKKIAGMLAHSHSTSTSNDIDGVALGIGVNLNMTYEKLSAIGRPAASILSETGSMVDPAEFAESLLSSLLFYRKIAESDSESLFIEWVEANALVGSRIEMAIENGDSFSGTVIEIRRDGAITLLADTGEKRSFITGDPIAVIA